mmetsp:Transcript_23781/g.64030  ORF Transcript_23781/g.64030 Transcript_23781/m.64030 type:complete len:239 (+) Transcript_23781:256-972(+)
MVQPAAWSGIGQANTRRLPTHHHNPLKSISVPLQNRERHAAVIRARARGRCGHVARRAAAAVSAAKAARADRATADQAGCPGGRDRRRKPGTSIGTDCPTHATADAAADTHGDRCDDPGNGLDAGQHGGEAGHPAPLWTAADRVGPQMVYDFGEAAHVSLDVLGPLLCARAADHGLDTRHACDELHIPLHHDMDALWGHEIRHDYGLLFRRRSALHGGRAGLLGPVARARAGVERDPV